MDIDRAIQLMIGPEELSLFGEREILAKLSRAQDILGFGELYLATNEPESRLSRLVVEKCKERGSTVALWTMVMADSPRRNRPPALDAHGNSGHGTLGTWQELGKGKEAFLFSCPGFERECDEGPALAVSAAESAGADAIFLDRIRYPSPANGLEFLGACSCDACRDRYRGETGETMPDLTALAIAEAPSGAEGARRFLKQAEPVLAFKAATIATITARYARAAHARGLRIGLDLFSPALSSLVGQNYALLAPHADFVKGMFYCKSRGPACLPLELSCFVDGLVASGTPRAAALDFATLVTELPRAEIVAASYPEGLPVERAAAEHERAIAAIASSHGAERKARLFAGIELVDYPGYSTKISAADRDGYLNALKGKSITACWNLLYISDEHLAALKDTR